MTSDINRLTWLKAQRWHKRISHVRNGIGERFSLAGATGASPISCLHVNPIIIGAEDTHLVFRFSLVSRGFADNTETKLARASTRLTAVLALCYTGNGALLNRPF